MTKYKLIIKNIFWNFLYSVVNRFGALIFTIILARFLQPEGYGLYSIVLSIAMIFTTFTNLGINHTLVRWVSYALVKEKNKLNAYYRYILKIKFVLTLLASLGLFVLSYPLAFYAFKNPRLFLPLILASFYIFILSFEQFYMSLFYSLEKVRYISAGEALNQFLRITLSLIIFYVLSYKFYLEGVIFALIFTSLSMILFSYYYTRKLVPLLYKKYEVSINKKRVTKFALYLAVAAISGIFFMYTDVIMLGFFVQPENVGYYRCAFSLVYGIGGLFGFLNMIFLPVFIKEKAKQKKAIVRFLFRYTSMLVIPSIFGLIALGKYIIKFIYGEPYINSQFPFYVLTPILFPIILTGIPGTLFSAEEKPKIFARVNGISCVLNIVLNIILISIFVSISQLFATIGAALATIISRYYYLLSILFYLKKDFKINLEYKQILKYIFASLIMFLVVFFSTKFIKISIFTGLMEIFLGMFVYCLFIFREVKFLIIKVINYYFYSK